MEELNMKKNSPEKIGASAKASELPGKAIQEPVDRLGQLTSIYETVGDIIFLLSVEKEGHYRFLSVNPAFSRVTGLPDEAVVNRLVNEVIPEPSLSMVLGKYLQSIQTRTIVRWEEVSDYPTGRLTGEVSISPVFDTHDRCTHLVGSVHDVTERKKNEQILRESEEKFKHVFDCSVMGKSITQISGEVNVNQATCDMLGYSQEELQGRKWSEITHPEDVEQSQTEVNALVSGEKEKTNFVKRFIHKNGSVIWVEVGSAIHRDLDGKPLYIISTLNNISERKRAEEALKESEQRYRNIIENSTVGIYQSTPDGRYLDVNPAMARIYGYASPAEMCSQVTDIASQVHVDPTRRRDFLQILEEKGQISEFVNQNYRKDGSIIWTSTNSRVVKDKDGRVLYYEGFMTDITTRKQAEEHIRQSEMELKKAQAYAHVGSWMWDIKNNQLSWSEEMYNIFGIPREDFTGNLDEVVANAIHPDDRAEVERVNLSVVNEGKPIPLEYRILHPDGSERVVWAEAGELERDEDGKPTLLRGIAMDITERKQTEQALRESEERFRALIEHSQDAITLLAADGTVLYDSPSIEKVLGYLPTERIGQKVFDTVIPSERQGLAKNFASFARDLGAVARSEAHFIHKDGSTRMIEGIRTNLLEEPAVKAIVVNYHVVTDRKLAEDALLESEIRFRTLFEQAAVGVALLETETGHFVSINKKYCAFLGYTLEEMLGKTLQDISHPEDIQKNLDNNALLIRGEINEFSVEKRYICKDGRVVWGNLTASPLWKPGTKPDIYYHIAIVEDITDRKQAEEALKLSELRFRAFVEQAPVAIGVFNLDGKGLFINSKFKETLGLQSVEEAVGRPAFEYFAPQFREESRERTRRRQLGLPVPAEYESVAIRADGSAFPVVLEIAPIQLSNGIASIAFLRDITDRKLADAEIARRVEELDALQKTLLEITAARDLSGLLENVVVRACQLVGSPGGGLYLNELEKGQVRCVVSYQTPGNYVGLVLQHGEGVAGKIAQTGQPLNIPDYHTWSGRAPAFEQEKPFSSVLGVPLLWGGQVTGVIDLLNYEAGKTFNQSDLDLLNLFAGHAAIAIENARLLNTSMTGELEVRLLSTRLADAEENERRRIARELHDQVGQSLSALSINLNILHSQTPEYLPGFKRRLEDSLMLIDQTTDHIRGLMSELRPAVLDDYGLKAALDWVAGKVAGRTDLKVQVEGDCKRFSARVEISLFRIAQEALANITCHARAHQVRINLSQVGADLCLSIQDDGIGFNPKSTHELGKSGLGLRLMRERAASIGGNLQVESTPGLGTTITVKYHDQDPAG
jgi:PAS domain S-box-containing protein